MSGSLGKTTLGMDKLSFSTTMLRTRIARLIRAGGKSLFKLESFNLGPRYSVVVVSVQPRVPIRL